MSFANESDSSFVNALAGVIFGGAAALVGVYVMIQSRILRQKGGKILKKYQKQNP